MPIDIQFAARVGAEDFACGKDYVTPAGDAVSAQDFRFFLSDLALITEDGLRVAVEVEERLPFQAAGVALLDFEDGTGACINGTLETNVHVTGLVPAGNYTEVSFSTSVPEALNHQDPTTLPGPLAVGQMTWGWLLGYKFLRAELVGAELVGADPSQQAAVGTVVHLGSIGCTMAGDAQDEVLCAKANRNSIALDGFELGQSVVVADLAALLSDQSISIMCHSMGDTCPPLFDALGVNYDTGAPLSAQNLFRLE
jgi:uncharacterized repeat protein (TIGR04052 family)